MSEAVRYIITFLLYENEQAAKQVAYCSPNETFPDMPLVIVGEGLNQPLRYPDLTQPQVEQIKEGHFIIHTDLIYNTFFFISRAEEILNTERDQYGRFTANLSILGKNNRLSIPLVDEYGRLMLKLLNQPLPASQFSAINLTHDIDTIAYYRHLRGALGGIKRGHLKDVLSSWKNVHNDPAYTFPWLKKQDEQVPNANVIYFVKDTRGKGLDYPQYSLSDALLQSVYDEYRMSIGSRTYFGLHSSAYENEPLVYRHDCSIIDYRLHRSHYLSCSIKRMQQLVGFGVTDDYTMGFADQAGFRLQTTRPVRWIDPTTRQLTPLILHPLTIMDCTLSNSNYMNLDEDEAYFYAQALFSKVRLYGGEVNLLWHNNTPTNNPYHFSLYSRILTTL